MTVDTSMDPIAWISEFLESSDADIDDVDIVYVNGESRTPDPRLYMLRSSSWSENRL